MSLIELMVVVLIVGVLAMLALPGMLANTQDLSVFQAAQRVAQLVQGARSRSLARGAAHAVLISRANQGTFVVQQGLRTIPGTTPITVPVNSCRIPGLFGINAGATPPVAQVTTPIISPVLESIVFGHDNRLLQYNVQAWALRGKGPPAESIAADAWICFTPSGRAYLGDSAANLAGSLLMTEPLFIDIARHEGTARQGLTRSVVVSPGGPPRLFSSQL